MVAAFDSLIMSPDDFGQTFPKLTVGNRFVLAANEQEREVLVTLGGHQLKQGEYYIKYIIPSLPHTATADQIPQIATLLTCLLGLPYMATKLEHLRLVPDRTRKLHLGRELYDNSRTEFAAAFQNDGTMFPHQSVTNLALQKFGVQFRPDKRSYLLCLQRLHRDVVQSQDPDHIYHRCRIFWSCFVQEFGAFNWNYAEIKQIMGFQCVPCIQHSDERWGYRKPLLDGVYDSTKEIAAFETMVSPAYLAIAWTQRVLASRLPPVELWKGVAQIIPSTKNVVDHLVKLSADVASKCGLRTNGFFRDLAATYKALNDEARINEASDYITTTYKDHKIWLNEDVSLEERDSFVHLRLDPDEKIANLNWLSASSILHGVPYDLPTHGLYGAKTSLKPYRNILRACGSEAVEDIKANAKAESVDNHPKFMMNRLRQLWKSPKDDSLCDVKILVEGKMLHAHKNLLAAVSPYFKSAFSGDWKESSSGIINLEATNSMEQVGTYESVGSVLEWVYEGLLTLDDGCLEIATTEVVQARLDHYLDILELSNRWQIRELLEHVENRILACADKFVRVENVKEIGNIAKRYHAAHLEEHCENYISANEKVVALVASSPESSY